MATLVFADGTFHETSMNDIADRAGVTKPVLYQHFASKRDLYLAVLSSIGDRLTAAIEEAAASAAGPREQVLAGFRAYFTFVSEQEAAFSVLFGSGARSDPEASEIIDSVENTLAHVVASLIDIEVMDLERRHLLAHGIVGLAEGSGRASLQIGDQLDPEELATHMARLAWAGLRGMGA